MKKSKTTVPPKTQPKPRRSKQDWCDSLASATGRLGIPRDVLQAAKRAGCPNFRSGKVLSRGLREWIAENADAMATASAPGDLKSEKLAEEIRKLKIANDAKERKLVDRLWVADQIVSICGPALDEIERTLVNEYPSAVVGLDVPQARVYGKRIVDKIRAAFNEAFRKLKA